MILIVLQYHGKKNILKKTIKMLKSSITINKNNNEAIISLNNKFYNISMINKCLDLFKDSFCCKILDENELKLSIKGNSDDNMELVANEFCNHLLSTIKIIE
jgi:hypothetical protein